MGHLLLVAQRTVAAAVPCERRGWSHCSYKNKLILCVDVFDRTAKLVTVTIGVEIKYKDEHVMSAIKD